MKEKLKVKGMTCANCALGIEKKLNKLKGVLSAKVSLIEEELFVEFNDDSVKIEDIISTVKSLGYKAFREGEKYDEKAVFTLKNRFFLSLILLVVLMYFSMGKMIGVPLPKDSISLIIQFALSTIIMVVNAKFFISGVKVIISGSANMDTLVSLGSISAYIYSIVFSIRYIFFDVALSHVFFESSAMVLTLVTLGKWLEDISKKKTGKEVEKLSERVPNLVTVLIGGEEKSVKSSEVNCGDILIFRQGDYVAVDGEVVSGQGTVDKSAITGESLPEELNIGSSVVSGSIINSGYVLVRADKVGSETLFSKILDIVKTAGASKSPAQKFADKIAKIFVPTVTLIAITVFVLWLIINNDLYLAFNFGISVLVVSCPCALGLATPVAVMAGTGKGASLGILFKDAETMQKTGDIDLILFDKTATLTVGTPVVTSFYNLSNISDDELKKVAYSLEDKSNHPLGDSIKAFCVGSDYTVSEYNYIAGKGIIATVNDSIYLLGNEALLKDYHVLINFESKGACTDVYLSDGENLLAVFSIRDVIKENSKTAVQKLKNLSVKSVMLTGDNERTAKAVSEQVGIDEYISSVLPDGKADVVNSYKGKGYFVAMVGDGINDSPALKSAEVGIAMGNGTDVAIESSDMVIVGGNPEAVVDAIALSRKTVGIIKGNLFWAFIYNVIAIPIAAGALWTLGIVFTPAISSACMCLSSLFVVLNALRIRNYKSAKNTTFSEKFCRNLTVKVDKMVCNHCKEKVKAGLLSIDGISKVSINLQTKIVKIKGKGFSEDSVKLAVEKAGFIYLGKK